MLAWYRTFVGQTGSWTCGGKEEGLVSSCRSARTANHRVRISAKPTQIAARAGRIGSNSNMTRSETEVRLRADRARSSKQVRRREMQPHFIRYAPNGRMSKNSSAPNRIRSALSTLHAHYTTQTPLLTPPAMQRTVPTCALIR